MTAPHGPAATPGTLASRATGLDGASTPGTPKQAMVPSALKTEKSTHIPSRADLPGPRGDAGPAPLSGTARSSHPATPLTTPLRRPWR